MLNGGEIIIDIAPDGTTKVEVKGVKGKSCKELTREFEKSLGKKVSDVDTPELHQAHVVAARH